MRINNLIFPAVCVAALCVGCQSAPAVGVWSKAMEDMLVQQQLQRIVQCPFLFLGQGRLHVMAIGEIQSNEEKILEAIKNNQPLNLHIENPNVRNRVNELISEYGLDITSLYK